MAPIITGATNIIAIDSAKKLSFIQKYNDAIATIKASKPVQIEPVLPQEPLDFNVNEINVQTQNVGDTMTNADMLSHNFDNNQNHVSPPVPVSANSDFTNLVHDIVKIQDDLDKVVAKLLSIIPDKEVTQDLENKEMNDYQIPAEPIIQEEPVIDFNIPVQESSKNDIPALSQDMIQPVQQEMAPFHPATGNIFDEPQGPTI